MALIFFRTFMTRTLRTAVFSVLLLAGMNLAAKAAWAAPNLVPNPGFEQLDSGGKPVSWITNTWGSHTAEFSNPLYGTNRAARVTVSNYVSGDAKWKFPPLTVTAGKSYTYTE